MNKRNMVTVVASKIDLEIIDCNMFGGESMTVQESLDKLLNRGEITQEEYEWFKSKEE